MKVLIISGSYPPINCGIGYYLKNLINGFELVKFDDFVVLSSSDVQHDTHVLPWVTNWNATAWPAIVKAVKQVDPDIIHIQYHSVRYGRKPFPNIMPSLLRMRFPKIRQIITLHEYHDTTDLGRGRTLAMIATVPNIIVSNQEDKTAIAKRFRSKKISVIPIGSNIAVAKLSKDQLEQTRRKYNPSGKYLILNWGIIDEAKGTAQLVGAMSELDDAKLVIVGEYDPTNQFHQKIKALIDDSKADIEWAGFLPNHELSGLLQVSDLIVLPYSQPVSPRRGTLLASLLHGKAIITTGPAREPLEHKINCYLMDNNDSNSIVNAVEELRNNPKLATMLAERAAKIAADFNWESIAHKHVELYQKVLAKTRQRS